MTPFATRIDCIAAPYFDLLPTVHHDKLTGLSRAKSLTRRKGVKELLETCDLSLCERDYMDEIGFVGLAG